MRRQLAILAMLAIPVASVLAQEAETAREQDERLLKPVTAKLTMVPLPLALKALGKDAGVPLESAMAMSSLKVTILVKDQPVGVVMARLADLYHGEWKASGDLYRLSIPSDWISRESAYIKAEDEERRKEAEKTIRDLISGASVPYAQVLSELQKGTGSASRQETLKKVQSPGSYLLGSMFARMTNAQWRTFWAGKPVHTSDFLPAAKTDTSPTPPPDELRRAGSGQQGQTNSQGRVLDRNQGRARPIPPAGQVVRVSASYDPFTGSLQTSETGQGARTTRSGGLIDHPYPEGDLAKTPFGKEALEWNRVEPNVKAFEKAVSGVPPTGAYFGGQRSLGDVLTWLHEQTGVPIVADAFRSPVKVPGQGGSIVSWLTGLQRANSAYLRTQDGFIMMRHGGFWRLRTVEVPEDSYAAIEKKAMPSLDDYATFSGALTPEQMLPFRIPNAVLTKFDPDPLRVGMAALRFYATLGSGERRAALAGTAVAFTRLGATSRERFLEALDDPAGQATGKGVPNADVPEVASQLGFVMGESTADRWDGAGNGGRRGVGAARRMLFGISKSDGVQFLVPVDG